MVCIYAPLWSPGTYRIIPAGILLKAEWIPGAGCSIVNTDNTMLAATFIYSMCFDFTVLVLTAWKLAWPVKRSDRTRLVNLIFQDGLIFFFIAFVANLIATVSIIIENRRIYSDIRLQVFMLLNLNAVMSIIANVPAAIASTVLHIPTYPRPMTLLTSIPLDRRLPRSPPID